MSIKIVYMGTPDFAVEPLRALAAHSLFDIRLVVSQPDRPQGRRQIQSPTPVKAAALALGLAHREAAKLRDGRLAADILAQEPDFIVTCAYGRILPPDILRIPSHGAFNIHASLLPKYRGAAPMQWTLINGEEESGISIIAMDEEMDHGDIYAQSSMKIPADMDLPQLSSALAQMGAELIVETLPRIYSGLVEGRGQDHAQATYVRMLERDSGLIDWNQSSRQIDALVRATRPWPGAFTHLNGKRLKIIQSHPSSAVLDAHRWPNEPASMPATMLRPDKKTLLVVCGGEEKSLLQLDVIQAEGGRALPVSNCAHNYPEICQLGQKNDR